MPVGLSVPEWALPHPEAGTRWRLAGAALRDWVRGKVKLVRGTAWMVLDMVKSERGMVWAALDKAKLERGTAWTVQDRL